MTEKRTWAIVGGVSGLIAAGLGWLIYAEYQSIAESRETVASIRTSIEASRKLLENTPQMEKDVIVLRETEARIQEILPDERDVNNFVRDLRSFEEDSGVRITSLKKKDPTGGAAAKKAASETFDKVTYELTFEADAFQLLSFLDHIESHSRFMRVPSFSLTAAPRKQVEDKGMPSHKVRMEVETFVYKPQGGPKPVAIGGYAHKRELLLGEISRRRQAMAVDSYSYHGAHGRRDPWVDPRIPVAGQDPSALTVQEQSAIVEALVQRLVDVGNTWSQVKGAPNVVVEMTMRAELEQKLATLEDDTRRTVSDGTVTFVPSERRLQLEVIEPLAKLRAEIVASTGGNGPTEATLREMLATVRGYISASEPDLALAAFQSIEPNLDFASDDPLRKGLVDALKKAANEARILADFKKLDIKVTGVAIADGVPPVAIINGKALSEGDLVNDELVVRGIRAGEIEFIFRGVVLVRRF
jgi:hypothetical protein